MKKCIVHYFSGTGGTRHAVKVLGGMLAKKDFSVTYISIDKDKPGNLKEADVHVFAFPVLGFGAPHIMIKYIEKLVLRRGSKVAVICICGGNEGQAIDQVVKMFNFVGIDVFYADRLIYPNNWTQFFNPYKQERQDLIIEEAVKKISKVADDISKMKKSIRKMNVAVAQFFRFVNVLYSGIGRRTLGKFYIADRTCTGCGKCESECPVHAISIADGKPAWNFNCEGCQRCINICPTKSIQTSLFIVLINVVAAVMFVPITYNFVDMMGFGTVFSVILTIPLYFIISVLLIVILDGIFNLLCLVPVLRGAFEISFTKGFRRYILESRDEASGENVDEVSSKTLDESEFK